MTRTSRELVIEWWDDAWTTGLWAAPWSKSLEGLTPEQAAWVPNAAAPGRHSIWQIVLHMVFWRENWLARLDGGKGPTGGQLAAMNFPAITEVSKQAWDEARRRFADSQARIAEVLRSRGPEADPIMTFVAHDSYHFGQINYLRTMQGLKPIV